MQNQQPLNEVRQNIPHGSNFISRCIGQTFSFIRLLFNTFGWIFTLYTRIAMLIIFYCMILHWFDQDGWFVTSITNFCAYLRGTWPGLIRLVVGILFPIRGIFRLLPTQMQIALDVNE